MTKKETKKEVKKEVKDNRPKVIIRGRTEVVKGK